MPNKRPTTYVIAIASAPPETTRATARGTFAPPTRALSAPVTARMRSTAMNATGIRIDAGGSIIARSGTIAPPIKERVEVAVAIDVSGSIGTEELNDFVSEIVGIARAFRNKLKMTLFTHETNMVDEWSIENGSVEKIKQIKIKGGGGTSFITPYDEFMKKHKNTKYLVWLTDGYGDTLSKRTIPIIWCLSKNSSDEIPKQNGGKIVKLK